MITIDVGTSSLKSIVFTEDGTMLQQCAQHYHPRFTRPASVEQDPLTWRQALTKSLREVAAGLAGTGTEVIALAITSQRASVIPVDGQGKPLRTAIMWQDKRSKDQCAQLESQIGLQAVYERTGLRIDPYFSLPKLLWLKQTEPYLYRRAAKFIGVQDYVAHCLTGRFGTDWTQGSRTMLMNIHRHTWDPLLLAETGINPSKLPPLYPPGKCIGTLSRQMAREVRLAAGTPVILAGGDQQCAALGMDILRPGRAEVTTGTGSFILTYCEKPLLDPQARTLCSCAATASGWVIEAPILTTGAVYHWLVEQLYPDMPTEIAYKRIASEATASTVGAQGLMLLPHFEGAAAPYWEPTARGMLYNLSLGTTRGDIARATLEGICLEIADNLAVLEEIAGPIHTLRAAGGLSRLALFTRILADTTDKKIRVHASTQASALGAAVSCLVSRGLCHSHAEAIRRIGATDTRILVPRQDNVHRYRRLLQLKRRLFFGLQSAAHM